MGQGFSQTETDRAGHITQLSGHGRPPQPSCGARNLQSWGGVLGEAYQSSACWCATLASRSHFSEGAPQGSSDNPHIGPLCSHFCECDAQTVPFDDGPTRLVKMGLPAFSFWTMTHTA